MRVEQGVARIGRRVATRSSCLWTLVVLVMLVVARALLPGRTLLPEVPGAVERHLEAIDDGPCRP